MTALRKVCVDLGASSPDDAPSQQNRESVTPQIQQTHPSPQPARGLHGIYGASDSGSTGEQAGASGITLTGRPEPEYDLVHNATHGLSFLRILLFAFGPPVVAAGLGWLVAPTLVMVYAGPIIAAIFGIAVLVSSSLVRADDR